MGYLIYKTKLEDDSSSRENLEIFRTSPFPMILTDTTLTHFESRVAAAEFIESNMSRQNLLVLCGLEVSGKLRL